jgi:RND family efflux transporter MFP subunit
MSRSRVRALAGLAAAGLMAMTLACGTDTEEEVETDLSVPVRVDQARRGSIRDALRLTGTVGPSPGAELIVTAPQSARIVELPTAEGDRVRQGDLLVRFEIPSLQADLAAREAEVARAQAGVETANLAAARIEGLFARGVAARREVEDARRVRVDAGAAETEAQAAAAAARLMLQRERVLSPFAGVVARRWHQPGDLVEPSAGDPILRVIDPARLEVEAQVTVADLPRVQIGGSAEVIGPGEPSPEQASVRAGAAAVDAVTGSARIRLEFATPTRLPVGTPVQVVLLGDEHRDVILVPGEAVVREGADSFVVVVADGRAQRRRVAVGVVSAGVIEVLSGIAAGEPVIVRGQQALPDGAAVTVEGP